MFVGHNLIQTLLVILVGSTALSSSPVKSHPGHKRVRRTAPEITNKFHTTNPGPATNLARLGKPTPATKRTTNSLNEVTPTLKKHPTTKEQPPTASTSIPNVSTIIKTHSQQTRSVHPSTSQKEVFSNTNINKHRLSNALQNGVKPAKGSADPTYETVTATAKPMSTKNFWQTITTTRKTKTTKRSYREHQNEKVHMTRSDVNEFVHGGKKRVKNQTILCSVPDKNILEEIKKHLSKEKVIEFNQLCENPIRVAYSELPPLVYTLNGTVKGILPELLREGLIERCCLGYNKLEFFKKSYGQKFVDQFDNDDKTHIVLPVEANKEDGEIFGFKYNRLVRFKSIKFFSKKQEKSHVQMLRNLAQSTLDTWPLFVVAMALSLCAGTIIWIMENMTNSKEFPKRFPHGICDGFWWAFISMTTVGYGDKTPSTFLGRTFAVFWILIGITITSLYVATLTSILTMEMSGEKPLIISERNVSVLSNSIHTIRAVKLHRGKPIQFDLFEDMIRALKEEKVEAFAIDDMTYKIKADDISRLGDEIKMRIEHKLESRSIGFTATDGTLIEMNKVFMDAYMDVPHIEKTQEDFDNGILNETPVKLFSAKDKDFIKITICAFPAIFLLGIFGLLLIKIKDCTFGTGGNIERIIMESRQPRDKVKYK